MTFVPTNVKVNSLDNWYQVRRGSF